jgi:hypothetical protein
MISERNNILVCCAHEQILQTLLRVIGDKTSLIPFGCLNIDDLCKHLSDGRFQFVLIGSGFSKSEEQYIREQSISHQIAPSAVILHFGGGSGLLFAEIKQAEEALSGVSA